MTDEHKLETWERRAAWPLFLAALIFLVTYAWPILHQGIGARWEYICDKVGIAVWGVFVVDYFVRLYLAHDKFRFVRRNVFDLLVVILPAFRPLRVLGLVNLLRIMNRRVQVSLHSQAAWHIPLFMTLVLCIAALATLDAERGHPDATILSFGDAFWWASVTVATVGYGDVYPVTHTGRVIAVTLMIIGIALVGVVTASVASWFFERAQGEHTALKGASQADVIKLRDEIASLKEQLAEAQRPNDD